MPKIDSFKGHPVLCLNPESRFPFSFGLAKAKLILENLEAIKKFAEAAVAAGAAEGAASAA